MRIHMVFLSEYAPETRIHKEARSLATAGHAVTVLALLRPGQAEAEELSGYRVRRLRLYSSLWRGRLLAPLVKFLEFSLRLWRFCWHQPAEAIQANDANALPISWLCAKSLRAHLVYDARELETGREFESFRLAGLYRRLWPLPEVLFIRSAKAVITVSEAIADELVRLYHLPPPTVIMNCPERQTRSLSRRLRDELHVPDALRIVLYQGSVSAGRGIQPFLEAIQSVPQVAAVVLGDGPLLPGLRLKVQSGEWQRVFLPGRVPMQALPDYIASADIGVALIQDTCLSHRYSLPNKLFEYIQAGLPVIASDLPEIARVVGAYEVGELVDPQDPGAIAAGLRCLLQDPQHYAQLQSNALRAAAALNWEVEGKKLISLYEQVAAEGLP